MVRSWFTWIESWITTSMLNNMWECCMSSKCWGISHSQIYEKPVVMSNRLFNRISCWHLFEQQLVPRSGGSAGGVWGGCCRSWNSKNNYSYLLDHDNTNIGVGGTARHGLTTIPKWSRADSKMITRRIQKNHRIILKETPWATHLLKENPRVNQ